MIKRKYCPELVQIHGFRSVKVLLDTPPGSLKNSPEAKVGSIRVQISLSKPVSFYMVKPRFCPSQDQSRLLQSSRQSGFGKVLSDQPAAYPLEHLQVPVIFKDSFSAGGWTIWVLTLSPKSGLGTGFGLVCIWFPLLEARSWQEAKSNLLTVALGKDDRIAGCWTLGPPV
ncbi:hypothetical protein F2Q69_00022977 [Brassica cretica]|uniref:Uncharacterized protein n=1 Tax=Brassica cretica TaxID=69181 RepID=A0A8S9QF93_BRACR|nr:hypothetical protein F2Q69_00022977 [Brassica cretica]